MTITPESLKKHDYNKTTRALLRKGTELKKKYKKLSTQLAITIKKCDQFLHQKKQFNILML